jgi:general secretion pathway protein A
MEDAMGLSITASKHLYEQHFGFSELPFSVTPDPRFFYNNSLHREAFVTLRYGIEARKGFIVITGEVGTGKTTLLRVLMHSVESTIHTAFIFNPQLSFTDLIRAILTDLGIAHSTEERLTLLEKLNDYLIEQLKKGHVVAILVDEAQDLSDEVLEELRLLSNLETDSEKLVQIVLMGQPEFERRLDRPELRQLKQRIALRCRLTPLPKGEVGAYINYRLKTAGYDGKGLFDARAVERIALYSQGIPRLINLICDNALLIAYASSKKRVSAEMIEEVAWDLQLTVPYQISGNTLAVDSETPRTWDQIGRDEVDADEAAEASRQPNSDDLSAREWSAERYEKRTFRGLGIGAFLGLVLTIGLGAVIYSQQSRDFGADMTVRGERYAQRSGNYVADLAVKAEQQGRRYLSHAEEYSRQGASYLAELRATMAADFQSSKDSFSAIASRIGDDFQQARNHIAQIPATIRDYSQQGRDYLSGIAGRASGSLSIRWENLRPVRPTPKTSADNAGDARLADLREINQDKQIRPDDNLPGRAETVTGQPSGQGDLRQEVAAEAKPAEPQPPKTPPRPADDRAVGSAATDLKPRRFESQTAALKREPPQVERENTAKNPPAISLGHFEVVQNSFLRDKPGSGAAITATLPPGTWVKIESKDGDYLRVSSLNDPGVRGYVHREDAFFERIR